ncbi:MAG: alpha/beta fold hydrolase [FCB group bacterium]|jgi:dienelactone hydrolase|nr:alpha/beta fold hydrolase [FCB group bacterium]
MWKKKLGIAAGILAVIVILLWGRKAYLDAHYFDNYDPGAPLNIATIETTEAGNSTPEEGYTVTKFTFDGFKGEKVPSLICIPMKDPGKKRPAVIFLHGIGQDKDFVRVIAPPFMRSGFALVSFDQFTQGERKIRKKSLMSGLSDFTERPAKTVNETRRLVDYLGTRDDIDPQRIYLVGASYGAVTGSTVLAMDKRVRAGVLVYGGGDFGKLLDSYANHLAVAVGLGMIDGKGLNPEKPPLPTLSASQEWKIGVVLGCAIPLGRYLFGVADPIHYADEIAPTPVYFQNGLYDVLVPAAAGKALQDAAREPKKITWYESDHVGINVKDTQRVLADGLNWLLEQDNPLRAPEDKAPALTNFDLDKT